ncbi:hypothetical protein KC660_01465, partial [Candidatus Dojkabacteria bacterium]|nr:hypothetical protein [Candidatus Dojkabacteria bacterium]
MKNLPSTRRGLFVTLILIVLGISTVAVVYFGFLDGNFDFRNRAGFTEDRWTLADIAGKELSGVELKALVDNEVKYTEDVQLDQKVKDKVENLDNLDRSDPDLIQYEERFGVNPLDIKTEEVTAPTEEKSSGDLNKSLINKVSADTKAPDSGPSIGSRDIPTIEGFNVDTFTGTATLSYPVSIPAVRGNISFSEGLRYSSRNIDELRINNPEAGTETNPLYNKHVFNEKNGVTGLGWNLTSNPTINADPNKENEYLMSMGGRNLRIKYQASTQTFYTYPKTDYKITRLSGGRWKVVDLSGTVYVFGSDDGLSGQYRDFPEHSANLFSVGVAIASDGHPYCWTYQVGWQLSQIGDQLGNTLEIDHIQDKNTYYAYGNYEVCKYTKEIYTTEVKYNYNTEQSRYVSKVRYQYSDHRFNNSTNDANKQKLLDKIVMENDGLVVSAYNFGYSETFKNALWGEDKGYFLLTSITKKGYNGNSGNAKPYTFCYQSLTASNSNSTVCDGTDTSTTASTTVLGGPESVANNYNPNNIYVVKANNGYAGEVEYVYQYQDKITSICANIKRGGENGDPDKFFRACTDDSEAWTGHYQNYSKNNYTGFYRVAKIIANNDSTGTLGDASKLKVTKYDYVGKSFGFATDFGVRDSNDKSRVNGLQFVGYENVKTTVYEPVSRAQIDSVRKFLTKTEQKTYSGIKRGAFTLEYKVADQASCYMVDPRKGMVMETNILDQNGNATHNVGGATRKYGQNLSSYAITYTNGTTRYRSVTNLASECKPKSDDWAGFEVFPTVSSADAEGKKSETETVYDFMMEPARAENWGLPIKQINYGNPDAGGDETYSYTKYINASNLGGQNIYDRYLAKNLFALPSIAFSSKVNANNYADINNIPAKDRSGQTRNYYDGANDSGGQTWNDVKGLITQSVATITQVYPNNVAPTKTIAVKTNMEYNSYFMPKRVTNSDGTVADTFYDSIYAVYPICQIQWKSGQAQSYNLANCYVDYTQKGESVKAMVTKSFYNENPSTLTQPNNIAGNNTQQGLARGIVGSTVDPNGARTDYEYDEQGRVLRVFNADPNQVFKTQRITGRNEDYANAFASYYDDQV